MRNTILITLAVVMVATATFGSNLSNGDDGDVLITPEEVRMVAKAVVEKYLPTEGILLDIHERRDDCKQFQEIKMPGGWTHYIHHMCSDECDVCLRYITHLTMNDRHYSIFVWVRGGYEDLDSSRIVIFQRPAILDDTESNGYMLSWEDDLLDGDVDSGKGHQYGDFTGDTVAYSIMEAYQCLYNDAIRDLIRAYYGEKGCE